MTASPIENEATNPKPAATPRPTLVPRPPDADEEAAMMQAEHAVFRDAAIGAVIGAIVCAPIWAGMVWLALRNSGQALLPAMAMAAGIGILAGVFAGGWAGTLVGGHALETFEREHRPKPPSAER